MNKTFNRFALSSAIALALAGVSGSTFAAPAHKAPATTAPATQKESVGDQVGDARREAQIWTTYAFNPHLKAFDLKAKVNGNVATLSGKVDSPVGKDLAEQIALGVDGITKVDNQIVVDSAYEPVRRAATDRSFGDKVGDATITASVKSKLLWNSNTDGLDIHVTTDAGRVVLGGTAETAAQKDLAGYIAKNTDGVVAVDNQIAVGAPSAADKAKATASAKTAQAKADTRHAAREAKADAKDAAHDAKVDTKDAAKKTEVAVTDGWITTKVKSTLLYSRDVRGTDINVDTKGGNVSLAGKVGSNAERDRAVALAKGIRGVKAVDAAALKVE